MEVKCAILFADARYNQFDSRRDEKSRNYRHGEIRQNGTDDQHITEEHGPIDQHHHSLSATTHEIS